MQTDTPMNALSAAPETCGDGMLRAENISKSFGAIQALRNVDLEVLGGTVHAVVGHNGAGKSTLMNILSGIHVPDSGRLFLLGRPVALTSPRGAIEVGISMVHQELAIVPDLDVSENIFLGREPMQAFRMVSRREMLERTDRLLGELELDVTARTRCSTLNVGTRQMIEIARAVSREARILILDEPTSALSETEKERLFQFIGRLKARGLGIIYVSHKLDEVRALADTITVLRDGKRVASLPTRDLDHHAMVTMMVGHDISEGKSESHTSGELGLEISSLTAERSGIYDINFSARRGEIVGLAGMLGSGRTELFEILFGVRPFDKGTIRVRSREFRPRNPIEAMRAGVALVPEDRRGQGIFIGAPIWKNAVLATFHDAFSNVLGFIHEARARQAAARQVKRFRIATSSINTEIQQLSGGNQQKVVLARWLMRRPLVLLLDDPTAGIDIGAKVEIHDFVRELSKEGVTTVISSSEFSELMTICHRILVIRAGRITREVDPKTSTEANLVSVATTDGAT
jgi:ABC-type sugar transport system ATPase subunit